MAKGFLEKELEYCYVNKYPNDSFMINQANCWITSQKPILANDGLAIKQPNPQASYKHERYMLAIDLLGFGTQDKLGGPL